MDNFLGKHPEIKEILKEKVNLLQNDPFTPELKTHKLTGKLRGYLAFSVTHEYRLVFYIQKDTIYLLAIGSHDQVY